MKKAKEVLASYDSLSREKLIELMACSSPDRCDEKIYRDGVQCFPVFAANMFATEFLCELFRKMTGARIDWHYVGGRVNMLLHPDDLALEEKVTEAIYLVGLSGSNYPEPSFYSRIFEIKREEIMRYQDAVSASNSLR